MDLVHNIMFEKLDLFPSGPVIEALSLSKGPNGVSFPSPHDWNRSSFRNFVFSSYLELRTTDKVQKPGDSEYYAPSSEPIRFYTKMIDNVTIEPDLYRIQV
jgi:hypothetical protein